jgi:hypothetical protein
LLIIVVATFFWVSAGLKKEPYERKRYMQKSALLGLLSCFIILALTGRLSWILAALSVSVAFVLRFMPVVLRYAPQLQRLWVLWRNNQSGFSGEAQGRPVSKGVITVEEAYKILGVSASATRQEIIDAHRKLILKNHPDRGGSSYLAAQINQAKDILLKK